MGKILTNEPLSSHSSFHIGGKARYFVEVFSSKELKEGLDFARKKKIPFFVVGAGTNCLFSDRGFSGLVIKNRICFCQREKDIISVGGGFSLMKLSSFCMEEKLSGLEFACRIPGTIGGAVFMNAGAFGHEIKELVREVEFCHSSGEIVRLSREKISFGYRFSSFQKICGIITSVKLQLTPSKKGKLLYEKFSQMRKEQPVNKKNIGSIFKNPSIKSAEKISAGFLIEECGLKGFSIGGAKIFEKHANFIINEKNAKADEVLQLMEVVQKRVLQKKNVVLHPEIVFLPFDEQEKRDVSRRLALS